jgi:hypothetical protein
LKNDSEGIS